VLSAGFRKYLRRSQLTLPLGCEQRELRVTATANFLLHLVQGRVVRLATHGAQKGFYDKNTQNSVTTENMIRIGINFLDHKDLENHLLQLCPQVMNHFVCTIMFSFMSVDKGCHAVMINLIGFSCQFIQMQN